MIFTAAGTYVAILNKTNFDGYYVKVFDYPGGFEAGAAWYYLNRVDHEGCLESIYPIEIFSKLQTPVV